MTFLMTALVSLACLAAIAVVARKSTRGWVELWSRAWLALSAGLAIAGIPSAGVAHLLIDAAAGAAFGVFSAALAIGAIEFVTGWPVRLRARSTAMAAGGAAGSMIAAGVGLGDSDGIAVVGALTAVMAGIIGGWVLLSSHRTVGSTVLSSSLLLGSIAGLVVAATAGVSAAASWLPVLIAGCGLGIVLTTVEAERDAAELAASEIEHLAYHDSLTGLPNRSLFFDRVVMALAQANREQTGVAVLFLDIDRFKQINDSLGHTLGDALLRAAAERIRECLRSGDTLARFGGDEFTILLPRVRKLEEVTTLASRILTAVRRPLSVGNRELVVTTSIGAALYPSDGLDAETLVRNADTAMYRSKELGRDNCQMYSPELNSRSLEKLDLENRLRRAVHSSELEMHYQPVVDAKDGSLLGFEALLRWRHPELGILGPDRFLEAAEISGLTVPIGAQALIDACVQTAQWNRHHPTELSVAVNLSSRQLHEDVLIEQVQNALEVSGLRPHLLCLEVTETHAMRNADATITLLERVRAMGVHVALDDFGTGYSSLAYLQRLPADILKLDRAFIRTVHQSSDAAIVRAVIDMARALGMRVVAEGVETENQLSFVREHGCHQIQGYLISRPISAAECTELLARSEPLRPAPQDESRDERAERRLSGAFPRPRPRHVWQARRDWVNEN